MSPQVAVLASYRHAIKDPKLFDARAFWLGSLAAREMIRAGRIGEAAAVIGEMRRSAKFLLSGPEKGHALGNRMLRAAQETFAQLARAVP